jgi:hypothetical protein
MTKTDNVTIVGYGTFITRNIWKNKLNVEVCTVLNYSRILLNGNWFPYALKSNQSFKALKFIVNQEELKELDQIEGVAYNLFKRVKTEILIGDNVKSSAFIYIPTNDTIIRQKLRIDLDPDDSWKEKIKKNHEVVKLFPELLD